MSIKTDGIINAGDFKVTDTVDAGFVKNNAAGDLLFGQAASAWNLIEKKDITSAVTSITFTGLNGTVEKQYMLIYRCKSAGANLTANELVVVKPNGSPAGVPTAVIGHKHVMTGTTQWGDVVPTLLNHSTAADWNLWRSLDPTVSFDIVGRMVFVFDPLNGGHTFSPNPAVPGEFLNPGYNYPRWDGYNAFSDGTRLRSEFTGGTWRANPPGQFTGPNPPATEGTPLPGIPVLTSLEFEANVVNGISAGSSWHLYKYAP